MPCVSLCLCILLHSEITCIYNCHEEAEDLYILLRYFFSLSFYWVQKRRTRKKAAGNSSFYFMGQVFQNTNNGSGIRNGWTTREATNRSFLFSTWQHFLGSGIGKKIALLFHHPPIYTHIFTNDKIYVSWINLSEKTSLPCHHYYYHSQTLE